MSANLFLFFCNLLALAAALFLGEYEVSKLLKPQASWLPTPGVFDLSMAAVVAGLAVINLAVLAFVSLRGLDHHRRWLWRTTSLAILGIVVVALILRRSFLFILFPNL